MSDPNPNYGYYYPPNCIACHTYVNPLTDDAKTYCNPQCVDTDEQVIQCVSDAVRQYPGISANHAANLPCVKGQVKPTPILVKTKQPYPTNF